MNKAIKAILSVLVGSVFVYLVWTFVTFNPWWFTEGGVDHSFLRFLALCLAAVVSIMMYSYWEHKI